MCACKFLQRIILDHGYFAYGVFLQRVKELVRFPNNFFGFNCVLLIMCVLFIEDVKVLKSVVAFEMVLELVKIQIF